MEVPGVTAAYCILYNQDHVCPEHFQTLYLGAFINRLNALKAVKTGSTAVPEGYETTTLSKDGDGNIGEHNQVDDYLCWDPLRSSLGNYAFVTCNTDLVSESEHEEADPSTPQRSISRISLLVLRCSLAYLLLPSIIHTKTMEFLLELIEETLKPNISTLAPG
jgi:hypothetical protein